MASLVPRHGDGGAGRLAVAARELRSRFPLPRCFVSGAAPVPIVGRDINPALFGFREGQMRKNGRVLMVLGSTVLFGLTTSGIQQRPGYPITPVEIRRQISARGASAVIEELYDFAWSPVWLGIARGAPEWLNLVDALAASDHADAGEQITEALGEALAKKPEIVLAIATPCNAPDVFQLRENGLHKGRESDTELALKLVRRRLAAVEKVSSPNLIAARDGCITSLREAESELKLLAQHEGATAQPIRKRER